MSKIDAPYTVYIGLTRHNLGCMCSSLGEDGEVDTAQTVKVHAASIQSVEKTE